MSCRPLPASAAEVCALYWRVHAATDVRIRDAIAAYEAVPGADPLAAAYREKARHLRLRLAAREAEYRLYTSQPAGAVAGELGRIIADTQQQPHVRGDPAFDFLFERRDERGDA